MKSAIAGLVLLIGLALSAMAVPQSLDDAKAAYDRGDYASAVPLYRSLADAGDPAAQDALGVMYQRGQGVSQDYVEAAKWYRRAAEQGLGVGQDNLGLMYRDGRGVAQEYVEAMRWFRKAAEQGLASAQSNIGVMYQRGQGVPQDYAEAVRWYRKAAEQGYARAQSNLGVMYREGYGVPQDDMEAVQWYRKAAEQGYPSAQSDLGYMYEGGRGLPKDEVEAVKWYRKAAEQGHALGQSNLGGMYRDGRGVAQDYVVAVQWYRKAAEQGNAMAQTNLGHMYELGRGVIKDEAEAVQWYRKAAEQGNTRAKTLLASIERQKRETDFSRMIADTVKLNERALPSPGAVDATRAALAHEVIEASRVGEMLATLPSSILENAGASETTSRISTQPHNALRAVILASFHPEPILKAFEHKLAEKLDSETLQVGLQWERSDLGRRITLLELEANRAEQRVSKKEFARQYQSKSGTPTDTRARACAQADVLGDETDVALPFLEALVAGGAMIGNTQESQPLDTDSVGRFVVTLRPMLRETARQVVMLDCLFDLQALTNAEFDKRLEFLRSDSGGRYARGVSAAMRDAFLQRAEVFTRTMLQVAQQLKKHPNA